MNTSQARKSLKTFITLGVLAVAAFGVAKGGQYVYTVYVGAGVDTTPKQVKAEDITSSSAKISWSTEKETFGYVEYGSTSDLGLSAQGSLDKKIVQHTVSLRNLLPNTKYYYKVGSGSKVYGQGESDVPYTFVTEASGGGGSGSGGGGLTVTEEGFDQYMYTSNPLYDLNKDGEVNSLDYQLFKLQQ